MMNRIDRIHALLTRLMMLILVLFMALTGIRFGTRALLIDRLGMDNAFTRLVMWDNQQLAVPGSLPDPSQATPEWWERYPFTVPTGQNSPFAKQLQWMHTLQERIKKLSGKAATMVELYTNEHLMFRQTMMEGANHYNRLMGWNLAGYAEYNNVIDLRGGYLTTFNSWFDVSENAAAVADFEQYLQSKEIPLLFVQLPNKISRLQEGFNGFVDYYNDNANRLVSGMRDKGVPVLDLREQVEKQGLNHEDLFFNTDHHWLPQTGLWAAGEISRELNENYGYAIDLSLLDPENYNYTLYEDFFLGTLGKKVTLARAKPDDFTLMHPKFPTKLHLQIPSFQLDLTGDFDIIYDKAPLKQKDYYHSDPYGAYLHSTSGMPAIVNLDNLLMPAEGKRVLVLGDSFSYTIVPFLGLGLEGVDFLDLRVFNGSLKGYLEENNYDLVVLSYSSLYKVEYDSHSSMYDFR